MAWLIYLVWVMLVTASCMASVAQAFNATKDGALLTAFVLASYLRIVTASMLGYVIYAAYVFFSSP